MLRARRALLVWDSRVVCISAVPKVEGAAFRGAEWIDLEKIYQSVAVVLTMFWIPRATDGGATVAEMAQQ